jgi:hypothetical protein
MPGKFACLGGWPTSLCQFGKYIAEWKLWGAPFLAVLREVRLFSLGGADLHLQYRPVIHPNGSRFTISIVTEAAPAPLLGFLHQSAPDRIAMNIAQLLDSLALAPNVVVIEPALPNMRGLRLGPQIGLPITAATWPEHSSSEAEFQRLGKF